jgi:hypothetical protein
MQNRFQQIFNADWIELDAGAFSEIATHDLRQHLLNNTGVSVTDQLEALHEVLSQSCMQYDIESGVNKISGLLYDMGDSFIGHYHDFVRETLRQHFKFPFYFQKTPTIRIQTPGGDADKHYPRYHNDLMYGHPPGEINIWIPLTNPVELQGHGFKMHNKEMSKVLIWENPNFIERAVSDRVFNNCVSACSKNIQTSLGKFLAFDSRCLHSAYPMQSHTRISIDVRIIAVDDFNALDQEYRGSGRMQVLFAPGHAYHEKNSEEI